MDNVHSFRFILYVNDKEDIESIKNSLPYFRKMFTTESDENLLSYTDIIEEKQEDFLKNK